MRYKGHHYKITEDSITPTGEVEYYVFPSREDAVNACLYNHRLHNGNATATPRGVIHCPTCGAVAILRDNREDEKNED